MDVLTFIAELVKALAWPLVVGAIAIAFRVEVVKLIQRIRKGKIGPAEFDFELAVAVLAVQPPPEPAAVEQEPDLPLIDYSNNRAAILDAWNRVVVAAHKLAYNNAPRSSQAQLKAATIGRQIEDNKLLDERSIALFDDLRALRNHAVHLAEFNPSKLSTNRYVTLAKELEDTINQAIRSKLGNA